MIATAFLSHNKQDEQLVERLAAALTRRGVVPWCYYDRPAVGGSIIATVREAIAESATFVALLTPESLRAPWVEVELKLAMDAEQRDPAYRVVPVLFGVTEEMLRADARFAPWFVHGLLDRITVNLADGTDSEVASAAALVSSRVRSHVDARRGTHTLVVVVDQRGEGPRTGLPHFLRPDGAEAASVRVFRPDRASRTFSEVIGGDLWARWRGEILTELSDVSTARTKRVVLSLRTQLSVAAALGARFDEQFKAPVEVWDDRDQQYRTLRPETITGDPVPLDVVEAGSEHGPVDLWLRNIGKQDEQKLTQDVRAARTEEAGPLLGWRGGYFQKDSDISAWARGVATSLTLHARGRHVRLFAGLPVWAVVALAQVLTRHVCAGLTLMEWDASNHRYVPLLIR